MRSTAATSLRPAGSPLGPSPYCTRLGVLMSPVPVCDAAAALRDVGAVLVWITRRCVMRAKRVREKRHAYMQAESGFGAVVAFSASF